MLKKLYSCTYKHPNGVEVVETARGYIQEAPVMQYKFADVLSRPHVMSIIIHYDNGAARTYSGLNTHTCSECGKTHE